ncbi:class I SAM-dependent methyltransferase [Geodermatophilus sp. DF01-2]|nr:class I SAM-dependent methyltransferase [Geodermatophilus sp. DF01_2]
MAAGSGEAGEFSATYWEDRYRGHAAHGSRPPNPQLVSEAGDLVPGTALDAGCGEGADARWLASRGWRVTAVDVAPTALRRAREHAAAIGPDVASRIDWVAADLTTWAPPAEHFDLVSAHYVHPAGPHDTFVRRLAAAVAPGGTLLVVGHDPSDRHSAGHVTAGEVAAGLDGDRWDVVVAEVRSRHVAGHGGAEITLRDAVLRACRRP